MTDDQRFAEKLKQPKFKRIPKSEQKVKIDKRFKSMFNDEKFQVKYTVDKRGRPVNHTAKEDLRRYYDISSGESSEDEDTKSGDGKSDSSIDENEQAEPSAIEDPRFSKQDKIVPDKIKRKLKNLKVDYARGEGALLSDSSSDDAEESEEDEDEQEIEGFDHAWGQLDQDAETTDEITCRLAACNMNWDRVKAVDLMILMNCFLPSGGMIESVTIYPSEFGMKRMQEEELKGPIELTELDEDANDDDEDRDGSKYHMERLRQYELNRLKYYYAVIVFDCPASANKVYEECDGLEYESTSTKFDLRFIPDGETFDQEPKDVCTELPDPSLYKPKYFTTAALQQTKVNLTWDETDPHRAEITSRLNSNKEVDYNDVQAYLASSSEEEDLSNADEDENHGKMSTINKYKALLQGLENEEPSKEEDGGMQISWDVNLKEKTEKIVKEKLSEKEQKNPFQQYLDKKKEKKKLKREVAKQQKEEGSDESDDIPSDVDLNDPYFAEELNKKEFKSKKKSKKQEESEDEEDKQAKAELELLLANNDEDGRNHFSLKKIQDRENEGKSKKKRKRMLKKKKEDGKQQVVEEDNFVLDVKDERFSALYSNPLYNIDPHDPHYKKTKAVEAIFNEKMRRRDEKQKEVEMEVEQERLVRPETQVLIKSMKRKAEAFKNLTNDKKKKKK